MAGRRHKKKHEEHEAGEAWLLPYSDLMTLLLAVFIVLFAVSKVDVEKAQSITESFQQIFDSGAIIIDGGSPGLYDSDSGLNTGSTGTVDRPLVEAENTLEEGDESFTKELMSFREIMSVVDQYLTDESLGEHVSVYIDERGLVVNLSNSALYDSGSADIKDDIKASLIEIGHIIGRINRFIRVEGHTDNVPIVNGTVFKTNFELSCTRAARVIDLFTNYSGIPPSKMAAVGYGEYRPIADNATEEGRAQNRRIEIIILDNKYDTLEQHKPQE